MFCDELGAFLADRDLAYRHDHVPGEKAYFDFAGLTLRYHDGDRVALAHIFTAALGWSNAIFACAYANETADSWLDGHHRAFVAFGGVTRIAAPNKRSAAQGVLGLVRDHGAPALEAACIRACALDTIGYEHVRRLLLSARTQLPLPLPPQTHEHVRGGDYFSASHREIDHAA